MPVVEQPHLPCLHREIIGHARSRLGGAQARRYVHGESGARLQKTRDSPDRNDAAPLALRLKLHPPILDGDYFDRVSAVAPGLERERSSFAVPKVRREVDLLTLTDGQREVFQRRLD